MNERNQKPKGLFINPTKANCSIYESGVMMYKSLLLSNKYDLDYIEIDQSQRNISSQYDFYAFNYHYVTMGWLDTKSVRQLPGVKITFVLETLPNNPFVLCPKDDFDAYCALDPTMKVDDRRVYAFPRPLEFSSIVTDDKNPSIPTIGTFGFATPGKGFELVVDAVNKEFDEAIIRINIPAGTYADNSFWGLQKQNYADYLQNLCQKVAKKGIQVIVTNEYMSKESLISWCAQNTLNCFLYNRNQPGLSATTDQAISSGRPLAISTNETFRHIHSYLKPYPFQSLKDSIASSQPSVLQMQKDWHPEKFALKFEEVLESFKLFSKKDKKALNKKTVIQLKISNTQILFILGEKTQMLKRVKFFLKTSCLYSLFRKNRQVNPQIIFGVPKQLIENTVLMVSHKQKQCGIYQYGINITEALKNSNRYSFWYAECSNEEELNQAVIQANPSVIIYNYYPATMPWLTSKVTQRYKVPQLGIMHEVTQEDADKADRVLFDYHLCPDPTLAENNPLIFKTRRLIPRYINMQNIPDVITIGSFGFGFKDKGFERLVETVQNEFDRAKIVLNLPFNDIVDRNGKKHTLATVKRCRRIIYKPGIELIIKHEFLSKEKLLDFLAGNTLNAFFYDPDKHRGISSCIEHALAVQRPIAITKCGMFRHIFSANPSIFIDDSTLTEIIANGIAPLVPFYNEWSPANFLLDYERILDRVLGKEQITQFESQLESHNLQQSDNWTVGIPNVTIFNRILDNAARSQYKPVIEQLFELVPEMMERKIPEANIQQAFVLDTVQKFASLLTSPKILCVGSYDDTAAAGLKKLGYSMEEIDPALNCDLNTHFHKPSTLKGSYDIIFSTSVLEHVPDDELFMTQIAELLAPGGTAILTCDYNDRYQPGDPIPDVDCRFYTQKDFTQRILPLLKNCSLVDEPQWDCPNPDFTYAGYYIYTFATLVFQKHK